MVYHNNELHLEGKMNSNGKTVFGKATTVFGRSMTSGENFLSQRLQGCLKQIKQL